MAAVSAMALVENDGRKQYQLISERNKAKA
jgi:hypothetical protein